jgi:tRNA(Arg) A34 adenosine deaminase TadA
MAGSSPAKTMGEAGMADITEADIAWMREALALAAEADLPFGTVIVKGGVVLARGGNSGKRRADPTAHGEMVAIAECVTAHGAEALQGATLYTSGEPCPMCMGAILWSRIGRVVYAASIEQLSTKLGQIMVPCAEIAARTPFHAIEITDGVLADEALKLFDRK